MSSSREAWDKWRARWEACNACGLGEFAHRHVLGDGPENAWCLVLGEAPGASENLLGEPFVGESGQLLRRAWKACQLRRDELWVTNLLACKPGDPEHPHSSRVRAPEDREIQACHPRLTELITMLPNLQVVVSVGSYARNRWGPRALRYRVRHLHCIHPSFLLRANLVEGDPKMDEFFGFWSRVAQMRPKSR